MATQSQTPLRISRSQAPPVRNWGPVPLRREWFHDEPGRVTEFPPVYRGYTLVEVMLAQLSTMATQSEWERQIPREQQQYVLLDENGTMCQRRAISVMEGEVFMLTCEQYQLLAKAHLLPEGARQNPRVAEGQRYLVLLGAAGMLYPIIWIDDPIRRYAMWKWLSYCERGSVPEAVATAASMLTKECRQIYGNVDPPALLQALEGLRIKGRQAEQNYDPDEVYIMIANSVAQSSPQQGRALAPQPLAPTQGMALTSPAARPAIWMGYSYQGQTGVMQTPNMQQPVMAYPPPAMAYASAMGMSPSASFMAAPLSGCPSTPMHMQQQQIMRPTGYGALPRHRPEVSMWSQSGMSATGTSAEPLQYTQSRGDQGYYDDSHRWTSYEHR